MVSHWEIITVVRSLILRKVYTQKRTGNHTVFETVNAVYHDKPLIFIGATFHEENLVSHHRAVDGADSYLTRADIVTFGKFTH